MLKQELLSRYGIVEWYSRESISDHLFSLGDNDPALLAESDGYNLANGKPFVVNILIGDWDKVVTQLIIFNSYVSKCRFVEDGVILQDL